MRIATGGISHETSTFARTATTRRDFENGLGMFRNQAIIERFRGTNNCTGGFIDGAERHGFELEGRLRADALRNGVYEDVLLMARLHPRQPMVRAT